MTTVPPGADPGEPPVGRDAVVAAILEAAADLFAARGPAATSIRDIAARSNVNHGLVFRHLGAKEQLVGAVLNHLGQQLTELIDSGAPVERIEAALDRQTRVMARVLLDGYPAGELQTTFPNMERLLQRVRPNFDDELSARLAVANIVALQLGWRLLGPFLRGALDLPDLTEQQVRDSAATAAALLTQPSAQVADGTPLD